MLSKILSNENIQLALDHLEKKKNVCGSDGIMLLQLNEYWKLNKDIVNTLKKFQKEYYQKKST